MPQYVPREIALDHMSIPEGVEILSSIWTITHDGVQVHQSTDPVNLTSKIFTDVFELGETYLVTLAMNRSDGPTITTEPFEVTINDTTDAYSKTHMPSVVDTPILTLDHVESEVPDSNIRVIGSPFSVRGNAVHDLTNWWMCDDKGNIIWTSMNNHTDKTSILINDVKLNHNSLYTIYAIYKGTNNDTSGNGSVTFRPNNLSELALFGDVNNTTYGSALSTRLNVIPDGLELFEYQLILPNDVLLYEDSNTTGYLNIPDTINDELTFSDAYEWYLLRTRVTINGNIIGWRDVYFTPKEVRIESTELDPNYVPTNIITVFSVDLPEYDATEWGTDNSMAGTSYQFPDGSIYLKTSPNIINRYSFNEVNKTFTLEEANVTFESSTIDITDPNRMNFYPLPNLKVLVTLDGGNTGDATILLYDYNPVAKSFTLEYTFDLGNKDYDMCSVSEFHLLDDGKVLFLTNLSTHLGDADNSKAINPILYVIDTNNKTISELESGIYPGRMMCNLIRLDTHRFIITSGVNVNSIENGYNGMSKVITLSDSFSSVIIADEDARFQLDIPIWYSGIPQYMSFRQATLKNNECLMLQSEAWWYEVTNTSLMQKLNVDKTEITPYSFTIDKQAIANSSNNAQYIRGKMMIALNSGARMFLDNLDGPIIYYK